MLAVVWTHHAIERYDERFGSLPRILAERFIGAVADPAPTGRQFQLHHRGICYVCQRRQCDVTIVTVFESQVQEAEP